MKTAKFPRDSDTEIACDTWPPTRMPAAPHDALDHRSAPGIAIYKRFKAPTVIESPEDFLTGGISQIVNSAAQTFSCNGDGIIQLVNVAIQIVEESYVVFPANDYLDQRLENIADLSMEFAKATEIKDERTTILQLGEALDDYGATLIFMYGSVAQSANLKLRVLSRLLLVNSMRLILDTSSKSREIDFQRLGRINRCRTR